MDENAKDHRATLVESMEQIATIALATADSEGKVDCASMFYTFDSSGNVYFVTAKDSLKAKNIAQNPSVAAVGDDGNVIGFQIRGRAVEAAQDKIKQFRVDFGKRYPTAKKFLDNPNLQYHQIRAEQVFIINFGWGVDWRIEL